MVCAALAIRRVVVFVARILAAPFVIDEHSERHSFGSGLREARDFDALADFVPKTFLTRASWMAQFLLRLSECEMESQAITFDPATLPPEGWASLPVPLDGARAADDRSTVTNAVEANAAKMNGQECRSSEKVANSGPDIEWLREVIALWESPLVRYAARITGDLESGRDVVQETFLRLCREQRSMVEEHLTRWLFTVCRSRALDVRRKESRMSAVLDLDQRTSANELPPDEMLERRETAGRLMSLLDHLPDSQQEVIRLKFQNDLTYREIADITGLGVSNVGFLLHIGIKRLRELMKADRS